MQYRVHGTLPDGTEDSWDIEGDTEKELQEKAADIVNNNKLSCCWSEKL